MFKYQIIFFTTVASVFTKPSGFSPLTYAAPGIVTAASSQVVARNYNGLALAAPAAIPVPTASLTYAAPAPLAYASVAPLARYATSFATPLARYETSLATPFATSLGASLAAPLAASFASPLAKLSTPLSAFPASFAATYASALPRIASYAPAAYSTPFASPAIW